MKPPLGELGNLRVLGAFAREARGNFYEFLPLKTAFLVNFGYVCSIIFETPLGQIGEFLRIFETPQRELVRGPEFLKPPQRNWSPEATLKRVSQGMTIRNRKEPEISTLGYPFGRSKYDSDKKKHAECAFLELS